MNMNTTAQQTVNRQREVVASLLCVTLSHSGSSTSKEVILHHKLNMHFSHTNQRITACWSIHNLIQLYWSDTYNIMMMLQTITATSYVIAISWLCGLGEYTYFRAFWQKVFLAVDSIVKGSMQLNPRYFPNRYSIQIRNLT